MRVRRECVDGSTPGRGMDTVPKSTFQLSVLGRFELSGPDGPIELTSKKLAAVLAFLACSARSPTAATSS